MIASRFLQQKYAWQRMFPDRAYVAYGTVVRGPGVKNLMVVAAGVSLGEKGWWLQGHPLTSDMKPDKLETQWFRFLGDRAGRRIPRHGGKALRVIWDPPGFTPPPPLPRGQLKFDF